MAVAEGNEIIDRLILNVLLLFNPLTSKKSSEAMPPPSPDRTDAPDVRFRSAVTFI